MTILRLKTTLNTSQNIPLEAEVVTPDRISGLKPAEVARLPVLSGNQSCQLGDFFDVAEDGSEAVTLEGDLRNVRRIGAGMKSGRIDIRGDAGMHLGAAMEGGEILVSGSAGDWTGAEMRGGIIHVKGNSGDGLGGAYRGSRHGMDRGMILVEGNAGDETGAMMRRGLIAVLGNTASFTGAFAIAGTMIVCGRLGHRPGAGMKRGTILTFQNPTLLPTFNYDCCYRPSFVPFMLAFLRKEGFPIDDRWLAGYYQRYSGDLLALGKGEILVYDQR